MGSVTEMNEASTHVASLQFSLDVEDGWPPVAVECLPFEPCADGSYRLLKSPLFIKDLSVDDRVAVRLMDGECSVELWRHVFRSGRTTIWLLRLQRTGAIEQALDALRHLGCNTVGLDEFGCYSIDVPSDLKMADVDAILSVLNPGQVAVAFSSMRHPEPA
jgi:uncharacterized protein YfaA (DUF2138 family)